jgi:ABC-type antimicrobial peptide transport system permease subunit
MAIFRRTLVQLAIGIAIGSAVVALVWQTSGDDPTAANAVLLLPLVAVLMMVVGLLAAVGPARRSLRIEPTEALRAG